MPEASTTGVPRSQLSAVTVHCEIVSPAGGVICAVIGVGAVTLVPSAGAAPLTVGTGPAGALTVIATCAGAETRPGRSVATYRKESVPTNPGSGV